MGEVESGGLKTPLKQKDKLYWDLQFALGIQLLKDLFWNKARRLTWNFFNGFYVKRRVIYLFCWEPFLQTCKEGKKKKIEKRKKRGKEGWNKGGKEGQKGGTKNRNLGAKEGKNRAAN